MDARLQLINFGVYLILKWLIFANKTMTNSMWFTDIQLNFGVVVVVNDP